ncbi:MAG TPA: MFS transporter [Thermomicrobiales bacterium]|nr:MFS transporter [Thermomicrobiales bacterium]
MSRQLRTHRRYYGWTIVGTLSLTETVSWGVLYYAFAVFLVPMHRELGWSNAQMTGAYSLALLLSGLTAPLVGRWIDQRGSRVLMTGGSALGVAQVLGWSQVNTLWAFYLLWAGIGVAMAATLYEPAFATVNLWFERDRAKAFLLVTLAAGFASTIFLPLAGTLVADLGWRQALIVLAAVLACLALLPHASLLRNRPEDLGQFPDGAIPDPERPTPERVLERSGTEPKAALRDPAFRWLAVAFSLETFASTAVAVYLIAYLIDRGDGARFAAAVTGLIGAAQVAARILATVFGNRISQIGLTGLVFALQAVAVAVLLEWQSGIGVLVAVLLLGMGRGVVTLMRAGLVAEFYGRRHFGTINGTLAFFLTGARALAPIAAGLAFALVDGYRTVFWALAMVSILGAAAMVGVSRCRRFTDLSHIRTLSEQRGESTV